MFGLTHKNKEIGPATKPAEALLATAPAAPYDYSKDPQPRTEKLKDLASDSGVVTAHNAWKARNNANNISPPAPPESSVAPTVPHEIGDVAVGGAQITITDNRAPQPPIAPTPPASPVA